MVMKVLKFHRFWTQNWTLSQWVNKTEKKTEKMFDGIFRAQYRGQNRYSIITGGESPMERFLLKRQNSWVLMVVLWGYLGCNLISSAFIERRYFSLMNYSFEGRCVDLKLSKLIIRDF